MSSKFQQNVVSPTFCVLNHDGGLSVIWRNGTARSAVAPLAPATNMVTSLVHLGGAPGLQWREERLYPLNGSVYEYMRRVGWMLGRTAVKANENKLLMLRKHKIKHLAMMMKLPSYFAMSRKENILSHRSWNDITLCSVRWADTQVHWL